MQGSPDTHEGLRKAVRSLLSEPRLRDETRRCWAAAEHGMPHAAAVYRELGARRWLAPHWPERYGGLGAGPYAAAVVAEELALAGVPDSARVNTIDNAGASLLTGGTGEQRSRHLPAMAEGRSLFSVLYTEPDAGSDLAALTTTAEPAGEGWRLDGVKVWNGRTAEAEFAVCAARAVPPPGGSETPADRAGLGGRAERGAKAAPGGHAESGGRAGARSGGKHAGLSLFIVPLDTPGVHVDPLDTLNPEQLFRVRLDGVETGPDALVGAPGGGWPLITEALGLERTGICFAGRARRWFDNLVSALDASGRLEEETKRHALDELDAELRAARLLSWRAVQDLDTGRQNGAAAAGAKWWASELAQRVALLAGQLLGAPAWADTAGADPAGAVGAAGAAGEASTAGTVTGPDAVASGAQEDLPFAEAFPDLAVALAEAPGLTLAAGTSPMQLDAVATELLDGGDPWEGE
ncbi:acyl-CoA dehydrogenase family protein [Streptomyces sp. TS71-3]|uniref:acyl-CoA dehydrogenase family protein n=1 Tax=Streptomyces sp. TS71-3 TaxID=2733862 RepID=UPI001B19C2C1|nr:acyl-CoA dehydrogenase family protein [Streptomyces sp. TS71-3]GHJ41606.1 hypothetical protein Sm713_72150 [Streptomyces sp. TS71-3]